MVKIKNNKRSISISLDDEQIEKIDTARGSISRSEFMREVVLKKIKKRGK